MFSQIQINSDSSWKQTNMILTSKTRALEFSKEKYIVHEMYTNPHFKTDNILPVAGVI